MTKLQLFEHQYNRLKRLYSFYEERAISGNYNPHASQFYFDNCTRINHLLFDLHVKYNEQ